MPVPAPRDPEATRLPGAEITGLETPEFSGFRALDWPKASRPPEEHPPVLLWGTRRRCCPCT